MCSIGVQVSELTEKACTYSTGRPGDPDYEFLKDGKVHLTVKNIVFDSKTALFVIYNNIFAEYDHRLKIKKVVVADQKQVLINAFAIPACSV